MKLSYYPRILPYAVLNFYPQFLGHNMNRFLNGPGVAGHFFSLLTDNVFMNLVFGVQHSEEKKSFDWLADEFKKDYKIEYSIYSKEEILKQPYKAGVKLYFFRGDPDKPFVLFCPPGAFLMDANICDGLHMARELTKQGYNFFIINYSQAAFPFHGGFKSARQDVSKALDYIMSHDFPINKEGYALSGGSAGAWLTALAGCDKFSCQDMGDPVPAALIALYPVASRNSVIEKGLALVCARGGIKPDDLDPAKHVRDDCPPVYFWRGGHDILVSKGSEEEYDAALTAKGIPHIYRQFKQGRHGCGLCTGLDGEGWLDEAVAFWEEHRK